MGGVLDYGFREIFLSKMQERIKKNQIPCPYCGSTKVIITKEVGGNLILKELDKIGKILIGYKKYAIEVKTGWQPSRNKKAHPEGFIKYQRFDRENLDKEDSYQEKIIDVKTGNICRDFKEPLRQHKS